MPELRAAPGMAEWAPAVPPSSATLSDFATNPSQLKSAVHNQHPPHPNLTTLGWLLAPRGTLWVAQGLWRARCQLILLPEPLSLSFLPVLSAAVGAGSSCQPDVGAACKRAWRV